MAVRDILHKSKLKDFENWLKENGWKIENTKGEYEALRATKPKIKTLIIFRRLEVKEHYSVPDSHIRLVYLFMKSYKDTDQSSPSSNMKTFK